LENISSFNVLKESLA